MKRTIKKLLATLLAVVMSFALTVNDFMVDANQSVAHAGGFNTDYILTGDGASDVVLVASKQVNKTQEELGYTEGWCDNFISDCAILANQANAIPQGDAVSDFYNKLISAGGREVTKSEAIAGDIWFGQYGGNNAFAHTEIIYANNNGVISSYGGNGKTKEGVHLVKDHSKCGANIFKVVRPNYSYTPIKHDPVSYSSISTYYSQYDMTVNVFSKEGCQNTINILNSIVKSRIDRQRNIKVQHIDCGQRTEAQVKEDAKKFDGSNITFCYDTSDVAKSDMSDFAQKAGFGYSFTTPIIAFIKGDGTIFKITQGDLEPEYLYQLANGDLSGEELIDLNISGELNYDYSFEVLKQLNALRGKLGLTALTMDEKLLNAAMQRAAEISIFYSHTRPNGEDCFAVLGETSGKRGENIAIGQVTPSDVMTSWINSPGHYSNMINDAFVSVGIGCFKASDGTLCWVQIFSSNTANTVSKNGKIIKEYDIQSQRIKLFLAFAPESDIHTLKPRNGTIINVYNCNKNFPYCKQNINGSLFNYTSSNQKVIVVSNNGYCTVKGNGLSTVTVAPKGTDSFSMLTDYRVGHVYSNDCDTSCNYCGAIRTVKHTYSNSCDTKCNVCGAKRSIKHTYKTTTGKATFSKNGSIVKKCTVCGKIASKKTIKYAKTFSLSASSYTYSGKVKTPSVTVKDSAGTKLVKNKDYTVTYAEGRKNVGTYKVTIKGKGNYEGKKTLSFKISPVKTTVSKLTAGKKSITVSITKKSKQVTGYQLQYSTSKKFTNAKTKLISGYKTTKRTLKELAAKKTYYVRVRTYKTVGKTKYYSGWSNYKSVKTK
ncbi:MAG: fibronectin type III domain-containing protein [Clostridia bacterium]|nr:fibronectin type III domain-containing protein [Clostridia bacterium]